MSRAKSGAVWAWRKSKPKSAGAAATGSFRIGNTLYLLGWLDGSHPRNVIVLREEEINAPIGSGRCGLCSRCCSGAEFHTGWI